MTDSLIVWWKLTELSDRLVMLVIVTTRSGEHFLRSQIGIGSESHCSFDRFLTVTDLLYVFSLFVFKHVSGHMALCF